MTAYHVPHDPTAVIGRRIGAFVIDAILGSILFLIVFAAFAESADFGPFASEVCSEFNDQTDGLTMCFNLGDTVYAAEGSDVALIYVIPLLYSLILSGTIVQGLTGGTPGKLLLGLRVVNRETGQLAGMGKSFVRSLLWIVDGLPCWLVGLVTGLTTKGHRRVGDMAAGTLVVGKADVGRPPMVPGLTADGPVGYGVPVAGGAPTGWGGDPAAAPPPPTSWAPPVAPPVAEPTPAPPAPTGATSTTDAPPGSGPQWDEARNAYIQWDPEQNAWVQWDDGAGSWKPIE